MDASSTTRQLAKGEIAPLLARLTDRNLLVIPTVVTGEFPGIETFEVSIQDGKIILTPLDLPSADEVRDELAARAIAEEDVAEAVKWARSQG